MTVQYFCGSQPLEMVSAEKNPISEGESNLVDTALFFKHAVPFSHFRNFHVYWKVERESRYVHTACMWSLV